MGQFQLKIQRAQEGDILRHLLQYLHGKEINYGTAAGEDTVTAAFFFESVVKHFHQNARTANALARDACTPDSVWACKQNNLQKGDPNNIAPRARYAEKKCKKRPIAVSIVLEAANLLSFSANKKEWRENLRKVDQLFRKGETSCSAVGIRWKSLLYKNMLPEAEAFRNESEEFVRNVLKEKRGNQSGYKEKCVCSNNEVTDE